MTERPILFSAPMVRGILAGMKTQTRRVINPQPGLHLGYMMAYSKQYAIQCGEDYPDDERDHVVCPYGVPGDRLWVRETFCDHDFKLGGQRLYRANGEFLEGWTSRGLCWKPAIHMPRDWSRITLEITDVRVQRVQEISEVDCAAEGIQIPVERVQDPPVTGLLRITGDYPPIKYFPAGWLGGKHSNEENTAVWLKAHYASLWDSINAKRGFGWDVNPWVWCLTFKQIRGAQ